MWLGVAVAKNQITHELFYCCGGLVFFSADGLIAELKWPLFLMNYGRCVSCNKLLVVWPDASIFYEYSKLQSGTLSIKKLV